MTEPCLDDFRWLVGSDAARWLEIAAGLPEELHRRIAVMRRDLPPARAHLVLEQLELRKRATKKFSRAERLFFTRIGLEQATDEFVAAYKAARFPCKTIADLCCGIGGDLMALAARGPVVAVDRDEPSMVLAAANCAAVQAADAREAFPLDVQVRDVTPAVVTDCAAWHIDPDRRPAGQRTTRVELHEPGTNEIESLLASNPAGAIKLSPAATLPPTWDARAELEWISRGRDCRQLVAWFGELTPIPGYRRATVLGSGIAPPRSIVGQSPGGCEFPLASAIGRYLFDPDAAVLAAHLEHVLAEEHALAATSRDASYLTGDRPIHDPAMTTFEVTDVLPLRIKPLRQLLRERRIGTLEIKQRSTGQDLESLRHDLRLSGEKTATLLVTRLGERTVAVLARRVPGAR